MANGAAIAVPIVLVVVLIAAAAGFYFWWRRRGRRQRASAADVKHDPESQSSLAPAGLVSHGVAAASSEASKFDKSGRRSKSAPIWSRSSAVQDNDQDTSTEGSLARNPLRSLSRSITSKDKAATKSSATIDIEGLPAVTEASAPPSAAPTAVRTATLLFLLAIHLTLASTKDCRRTQYY
jgi:hypothetical protein